MKFEEYTNTDAGLRYEAVWRFDRKMLGGLGDLENNPVLEKLSQLLDSSLPEQTALLNENGSPNSLQGSEAFIAANYLAGDYVEVPCPSHDNPILMIPKQHRREFFDDLFKNDDFLLKRIMTGFSETIRAPSAALYMKPCWTACKALRKFLTCSMRDPTGSTGAWEKELVSSTRVTSPCARTY
jgi:hypothetical protein